MFLFGKLKAGNASYQSPKSVLESHISEFLSISFTKILFPWTNSKIWRKNIRASSLIWVVFLKRPFLVSQELLNSFKDWLLQKAHSSTAVSHVNFHELPGMLATTISYDIIPAVAAQKMLHKILLLREYFTELNERKIMNRYVKLLNGLILKAN